MAAMELIESHACHAGEQRRYRHESAATQCAMTFSVYLPPQALRDDEGGKVPFLYWLSGLTCTDENFSTKAGAQAHAARHGIALIIPDTSPRGEGVPDDPDGGYDLGLAASFYVNATEEPWRRHYQMYDYIVEELPGVVEAALPFSGARSIFGHSMGGHGALVIALRNPDRYRSVSAFSPIVNPAGVRWGQKALRSYLGSNEDDWRSYDSCALIAAANPAQQLPLRVDQGRKDEFLSEHLKTERLIEACERSGYPADIRLHAGYDHSYYFIQSYIAEHMAFHAGFLR